MEDRFCNTVHVKTGKVGDEIRGYKNVFFVCESRSVPARGTKRDVPAVSTVHMQELVQSSVCKE
jgi:hypothetical protein